MVIGKIRCPVLNVENVKRHGSTVPGVEVLVSGTAYSTYKREKPSSQDWNGPMMVAGCPDYDGKKCPHRDGDCIYKEGWK